MSKMSSKKERFSCLLSFFILAVECILLVSSTKTPPPSKPKSEVPDPEVSTASEPESEVCALEGSTASKPESDVSAPEVSTASKPESEVSALEVSTASKPDWKLFGSMFSTASNPEFKVSGSMFSTPSKYETEVIHIDTSLDPFKIYDEMYDECWKVLKKKSSFSSLSALDKKIIAEIDDFAKDTPEINVKNFENELLFELKCSHWIVENYERKNTNVLWITIYFKYLVSYYKHFFIAKYEVYKDAAEQGAIEPEEVKHMIQNFKLLADYLSIYATNAPHDVAFDKMKKIFKWDEETAINKVKAFIKFCVPEDSSNLQKLWLTVQHTTSFIQSLLPTCSYPVSDPFTLAGEDYKLQKLNELNLLTPRDVEHNNGGSRISKIIKELLTIDIQMKAVYVPKISQED